MAQPEEVGNDTKARWEVGWPVMLKNDMCFFGWIEFLDVLS